MAVGTMEEVRGAVAEGEGVVDGVMEEVDEAMEEEARELAESVVRAIVGESQPPLLSP